MKVEPTGITNSRSRALWKTLLMTIGGIILLLCIVAVFLPQFDGPYRRQHANEAIAVGAIHRINELQERYRALHPDKGFTCELRKLAEIDDVSDPYRELGERGDRYAGYVFRLAHCTSDPRGTVAHFEFTAAPYEPGRSGFRAFCTDENGTIWVDSSGSISKCLSERRPNI